VAGLGEAGSSEGDPPTVSGVALKAGDTGRVLMIQRGLADEKDPARGTWEFPGGHHEEGDQTSLHAGVREWEEEVGQPFPSGGHLTGVSRNGLYLLHHVVIPSESDVKFGDGRGTVNPDDPDGDAHEQSAWWQIDHAKKNPALREECKTTPWGDLQKAAAIDSDRDKVLDPDWIRGYTHAIDNEPHQLPDHWNDAAGRVRANNYTQGYSEGRNAQGQKWGSRKYDDKGGFVQRCEAPGCRKQISSRKWDEGDHDWIVEQDNDEVPHEFCTNEHALAHMDKNPQTWDQTGEDYDKPTESTIHDIYRRMVGRTATLHDEPEAALPSTDGATEDPDSLEVADDGATPVAPEPLDSSRQALWGFPESTVNPQAGDQGVDPEYVNSADYGGSPGSGSAGVMSSPSTPVVASVDPILAEFWKTAGGAALRADASGGGSSDKGARGGAGEFSDSDIASAAKAVLAKMAAKDFDYAEQRELIEEGLTSNARARNFDEMDLAGTHYALLEDDVSDDEMLWV
jgi:8-oxo-dGTP pyrophosphatase MutT (NUDIX family)